MRAPETIDAFVELSLKSGLLEPKIVDDYCQKLTGTAAKPESPRALAEAMVRDGLLTKFQADSLLIGKWRGFIICEKYRLLQKLGSGGMGSVYLCEHMRMRRRVALKVLPLAMAEDPASVERFCLEARAVAALDHPNIVRAHDIDNDGKLHFIVLEYIDGNNLHDLVRKQGPLSPLRAANFIRQAAEGLQHAHEAGVVHRDIKPGNLLLDRNGTIKLLDMGLARFFHEEMDPLLLKQELGNTLGTAEYVAPEQVDESLVDIRADIYSLGATFYYLLTGHNPFPKAETTQQKLTWAQVRRPKPVRDIRPEIPEELSRILDKMMAKEVSERYQTPAEVAAALAPWTQAPLAPPSEEEMPSRTAADQPARTPPPSRNTPPASSRAGPATPKEVIGPATPKTMNPDEGPESSSAVVTLKAPVRKTIADKRPSSKPADSKVGRTPEAGAPSSPSPAGQRSRGKAPATSKPAVKSGVTDSDLFSEVPPPSSRKLTPARSTKTTAAKTETRPAETPKAAKPAKGADSDDSDRFASRVLMFGSVVFAAGLLLLLWWLFSR